MSSVITLNPYAEHEDQCMLNKCVYSRFFFCVGREEQIFECLSSVSAQSVADGILLTCVPQWRSSARP